MKAIVPPVVLAASLASYGAGLPLQRRMDRSSEARTAIVADLDRALAAP